MKLRLFPKIALIMISLATLPVMVVGWQTYTLNKEHLQTNILELHTNLANSLSSRIRLYLDSLFGKTRAVVGTLRVQGIISPEPLQAFINSNEEFISIAFTDRKGKELVKASNLSFPEEKNLNNRSADPVFLSFLSQDSANASGYEPKFSFYYEKESPRLKIVFPYNPQNISFGVFFILVSIDDLWADIAKEGAGVGGGGREAFIVDENGTIIFHSNIQMAYSKTSAKNHPIVSEALQRRWIGSKEYKDEKGHSIIGSYSEVKGVQWFSIIQQPKETAYYAVHETRKRALEIIAISIIVASFIAFLFAKHLSKPIFSLIFGAQKVAEGDFSQSIQVKTNDEMSDLAKTFNKMIKELKRYSDLQVDRIIEEKTKTEAVIFSIADGLVMTDREGSIQLINDHAIKIFSLDKAAGPSSDKENPPPHHLPPEKNYMGKNLLGILPDVKFREALGELLAQPGTSLTREVLVADESYEQHYQLSSELVHTPRSDKKLGVVTVVHDVTLERQMDALKEGFLHSITHDLRNPMTSIMGFLKFLLDGTAGAINPQQKKMLDIMDRASTRLLGMINDILDIAKIEAGKLEIEIAPVAPLLIMEDIKALYQPLAENKSIRLQVNVNAPPDVKPENLVINGDPNQIERIIGNLVANAIKYTPADGTVTLTFEDFPDKVQIVVTDTGPGIPEDYRTKIFDKFQQVKGEKRGGTGLGLTICKYFIELHKGKIWVEENAEKGSRFVFWIPKGLAKTESGEIIYGSAAS